MRLAPLDLERFESQMESVHRLLTEAFRDNLGFVPIGYEDFLSLYGGMKAIALPELIPLMWSREGQAVGFGYLFPDHARAMRKMNGDAGLLGKLRFLLGRERPDRLILHTVAVQKDFRRRGMVETVLARLMRTAQEQGFTHAVGALAKEGRTLYDKAGPPTREYRLYSRPL
jgi:ribosomal protein S18 acetylase RimI-like enzyme